MEAGNELDVQVAKLCGLMFETEDGQLSVVEVDGPIAKIGFAPSTDLNDAFWAAEKVGLFIWNDGGSHLCCDRSYDADTVTTTWMIVEWDSLYEWNKDENSDKPLCEFSASESDTPALAICEAILALMKV